MSNLMINLEHTAPLGSAAEASRLLIPLAAALLAAARRGELWVRFRGAAFSLDADTIDLIVAEERFSHTDELDKPTHLFSLTISPEGPGEVGFLSLNVRPEPAPDVTPGLALAMSLPDGGFDLSAGALRVLFERCLDAVSTDVAMIGPGPWMRELGVGWATFSRRLRHDLLPAGARVIAIGNGSLIIAHTEEPASESDSARDAMLQLRDALSRDPPKNTATAPEASPAREAQSTAAPAQPSYLAAPVPSRPVQRSALASTALGSALPLGPALPFAPASLTTPAASAKRRRPPPQFTGTADGVEAQRGPVMPFVPSDAPLAFPDLTLEQYADLRAQLTTRGEEDAEAWQQFGVLSRAIKEALQARFATRFRQDPAMQARFVDLVQKRLAELRTR